MTKAFTEGDFLSQLNQDFNWRLKEISSLKLSIRKATTSERSVLLRSMATILYAHWEGHVKFCAIKYFEHLTLKKLLFRQLNKQFYRNHFLSRFGSLSLTRTSIQQRCDLIDTVLDSQDQRFSRINPDLIDTGSNLNGSVLQNICLICGVKYKEFIADEDFIDRILLRRRNAIAHGEETYIDIEELDELASKVIGLMRRFRDELQNIVVLRTYVSSS